MGSCLSCGGKIPSERKASAKYCCEAHYYSAKKNRSKLQYLNNSLWMKELKRNEDILKTFILVASKKNGLDYEDLEAVQFNFGITSGETDHQGKILKVILSHAYYIDNRTKKVSIWKL